MKSFIIRIVLFVVAAVPLVWFFYLPNADALGRVISVGIGIGIAALFLGATEPRSFPDRLAKSFTMVSKSPNGLHIESTWLFWILVMGPLLPVLAVVFAAGVFDHSFFPSRPGNHLIYTMLGLFCGATFVFLMACMPSGYRCTVSKGHVRWVTTYFGRALRTVEYPNARIDSFAPDNGAGGGPVVTIRYDTEQHGTATAKLKFRNLVDLTPEQFHEALSEYLDDESRHNASRR